MESISAIEGQRRLKEAGLKFVGPIEVSGLFGIEKENTVYKLLQRWEKYGVVARLTKGLYRVVDTNMDDFEVANRLIEPSYVSLETALNFYGILSQFPYVITSVTTRKAKRVIVEGKEYEYTKLANNLYWGYEKTDSWLMAVPEKAVVDQLYLVAKGLRSAPVDEWDMSLVNKSRLADYCRRIKFAPFIKLVKNLKLMI